MKFTQEERQSIMTWRLKMALMVDQAVMADARNTEAEVTSLHIAMLEMAIAGMRTIAESDAKRTVNPREAGQQLDEAGRLAEAGR